MSRKVILMHKKYLRMMFTLVIILGAACLVCSCGGNAEKETEASEQNDSYYDFEFHRGARDARPENTLYAFQYSIEHGATTIECDMLMTKDEEIVLAHNDVLNPDIDCVSPYYEEITEEQVKEAHEFGMTVVPWTINSEEDMQRMLDIGVDGMITDMPWIMRPVLEKAGKKLVPEMKYDSPYHIDQDHIEVEGKKAEGGNDAAV